MATRAGIYIVEGCSDISILGGINKKTLRYGYVICTTKEFSPEELSDTFGNYCVKISNPAEFLKRVTATLHKKTPIKEAAMGLVKYNSRNLTGLQPVPGHIGFVKPSVPYASQKEFRMLWPPLAKETIEPFLLCCSDASELCYLIT